MSGAETLFAISAMSTAIGMQQARSQTKARNRAAQARADAQVKQLKTSQQIEERRRKEGLKRNLATQRARFGASGVGGVGGSSDALLRGLSDQTEREIKDRNRLNLLQTNSIYTNLANSKRLNLLESNRKIGSSLFGLAEQGVKTYHPDFKK